MPLYVADYLADTGHLTTVQHGAYLLLIMHYWKRGSLPAGDDQLASIVKMTAADWKKAKPVIATFFSEGWKHSRIEAELSHAAEISSKRSAAGKQSHGNSQPNADQKPTQSPLPLPSQPPLDHSLRGFQGVGESVKKIAYPGKPLNWTPPRHGAIGRGRIYIRADHAADWASYAADFKTIRGVEPQPNEYGGKWFKLAGESAAA